MLLANSVWALFFLSAVLFIILISVASRYHVINCSNQYTCEDGLSVTPDYTSRKNILSWANGFSWAIIILFVLGLFVTYYVKYMQK